MIEQTSAKPEPSIVEQGTLFDKAELECLTIKQTEWEETTVKKSQKRMPERDNLITTSGVPIDRVYTCRRIMRISTTRGILASLESIRILVACSQLCTVPSHGRCACLQVSVPQKIPTPVSNISSHRDRLGLSTAFDMPTLYGYDTDHPLASGEFGKCGVAVSSLADMEILFDADYLSTK